MEKNLKLLVIDTSYTYQIIKDRGLEESVTCRDLGGFFKHVWTIHPVSNLINDKNQNKNGLPIEYSLNSKHTFIEGKLGRFVFLKYFPVINFFFSQISLIIYLYSKIKKESISVIRSGDPLYTGLLGYVLSRLTKVPLVVRVGSNNDKIYQETKKPMMPKLFKKRSIEKICEKYILSKADLIAAANFDNLKFAISNGANPTKSTVFPYGNLIDRKHFIEPNLRLEGHTLINSLKIKSKNFVVYLGRLETVKRTDDTIKVVAELIKQGNKIDLLIIGDGSKKMELENLVKELNINEHVFFCGNQNQDWISRVLPMASAILSPHTGRALVESCLSGTPIIAYDIDWQSEVIKDGETGELVPFKNLSLMTRSLKKILSNTEYAKKIGIKARDLMMEKMDIKKLNENEIRYYQKIIL